MQKVELQDVNNLLCEKVQLKPNSVVQYKQRVYFNNTTLGHKETLIQNINTLFEQKDLETGSEEKENKKEIRLIDQYKSIEQFNIPNKYNIIVNDVNEWANKIESLYNQDKEFIYQEYGRTLKEFGTLSRVQLKNIKRVTQLFANCVKSANKNNYLGFLTLTLPSEQIHSDKVIRRVLSKYLDLLKKTKGLTNYVWKGETQKNGNIHFHIMLDKWIDKKYIKNKWNDYINYLGYVDRYAEKFGKMSLFEYLAYSKRIYKNKYDEKKAKNAFIKGKRTNWKEPNTTKIETPKSNEGIASYCVKYMYKTEKDKRKIVGSIWGASNAVKKLKYPSIIIGMEREFTTSGTDCAQEYFHLVEQLENYEIGVDYVKVYTGEVWQKIKRGYKAINRELKAGIQANINLLNGLNDQYVINYN